MLRATRQHGGPGRLPAGLSFCALVVVTGALSCGPDDEPFVGYVSRSRFFEYHTREPETLCPTLLDRLDEHAGAIGGKVGVTPAAGRQFRYYKFRDLADFTENGERCALVENGACAVNDAVFSTEPFHTHELTHTYAFRGLGSPPAGLLTEGVAVALSCDPFLGLGPGQRPRDLLGSPDWRDLLYLFGDSTPGYMAAGVFVTRLARRYGWRRVGELYGRVQPSVSRADFERAFAHVFPISMDEAWAEALDAPGGASCETDWQCAATPLSVGETAIPDCDGEMHRIIDVADPAVAIRLEGKGTQVRLASCTTTASSSYLLEGILDIEAGSTHWLSLPPAPYAMFHGEARFPSQVEFQSSLPGGIVGGSCESAGVVSLDPSRETDVDFPLGAVGQAADAQASAWIRLAGGGHDYQVMLVDLSWTDLTTDAVTVCNDCGAGAACIPIRFGELTTVSIGNDAVLHLRGVYAFPPPSKSFAQVVFYTRPAGTPP